MTTPSTPSAAQLYRRSAHAVTPADRELFDRHLATFVPPGAFDVHAHAYKLSASGLLPSGEQVAADEDKVGLAAYREHTTAWMGDRCPSAGLFFGLPTSVRVDT